LEEVEIRLEVMSNSSPSVELGWMSLFHAKLAITTSTTIIGAIIIGQKTGIACSQRQKWYGSELAATSRPGAAPILTKNLRIPQSRFAAQNGRFWSFFWGKTTKKRPFCAAKTALWNP